MKKLSILLFLWLFLLTGQGRQAAVAKDLPVVGTQENLIRLIENSRQYRGGIYNDMLADSAPAEMGQKSSESADYSQTNVQVEGIDESDIVKTDGTYIYQIQESDDVVISRAYPAESMKVLSRINIPDAYLREMYVDGDILIVLGQQQNKLHTHIHYDPGSLVAIQYDISDREQPKEIRRIETEGSYVTSRKIGSNVYIVSNKWLYHYALPETGTVICKDTVNKEEKLHETGLEKIRYFPDSRHENYIIITAFDTAMPHISPASEVFLGSGYNVYMSKDSLYVASDEWDVRIMDIIGDTSATKIHKFSVNGLRVSYQDSGIVPGSIINQFSMDEYDGHFRIATTTRRQESSSGIYILDGGMNIVGKIDNIAPREQIYSARFVGEKGYLVTFEIIDPLFVVDLSDHQHPKILGELKIPGFSNYLHPLDENTLLGLGRDTEIVENPWGVSFRQKGIKLAIFDVTDMENPKEKFVEYIGDSSAHSEALYNHKAIMFRNDVMAFPVISYVYDSGQKEYAGAVVYRVSADNGFTSLGSVSHGDLRDYASQIKRTVSINEYLYTISDSMIQAHRLDSMQQAGSCKLQ